MVNLSTSGQISGSRSKMFFLSNATVSLVDTTLVVRDVLNAHKEGYLSSFMIMYLFSLWIIFKPYLPLTHADCSNTLGWVDTFYNYFTIQSAYKLQQGNFKGLNGDWNSLWSWREPYKIQTFMWFVAQERILTNSQESKWGVAISPFCLCCQRDDETTTDIVMNNCKFSENVSILVQHIR